MPTMKEMEVRKCFLPTWSLPVFPKIQFDDFDILIFLLQVWPERPQIKLDIHELLFHIIGFSPALHLSNR